MLYASRNYIDIFFAGDGQAVIGKQIENLQQIPLEDRNRIAKNLRRIRRSRRELIDSNKTILPNGSIVSTRWRLIPILGSSGELVEIKAIGELMGNNNADIPCGGKCGVIP